MGRGGETGSDLREEKISFSTSEKKVCNGKGNVVLQSTVLNDSLHYIDCPSACVYGMSKYVYTLGLLLTDHRLLDVSWLC